MIWSGIKIKWQNRPMEYLLDMKTYKPK